MAIAVQRHDRSGLRRDGGLDLVGVDVEGVARSTSTKTGLMPFHSSECAVATKEYGVVNTSPADAQRLQRSHQRRWWRW
jgi:hypothetical protein